MKLLQKLWAALTAYPDSWDDYFPMGRWLIYKRLPLLLGIALAAAAVWLWQTRPVPAGIPVFSLEDPALSRYSGEAVLETPEGVVVYRGQVAAGLRSGYGREIAVGPDGEQTVYEGDFFQGRYQGQGRLFDGGLLYEGGFLNGLYEGEGTLYSGENVLYRGGFLQGAYQGRGTLYEGGVKLYEGDFLRGLYDGTGTLYGIGGETLYTGGFRAGKYEGQGVELSPEGLKRYEGGFLEGRYDGEGILYDGERLRFRGMFTKGAPGPSGSLYNQQGLLLYEGPAYRGQPDYLALLGLPMGDLQACVREVPSIYYSGDQAGFLYRELGFAVVVQYDYGDFQPVVPALGGGETPPELFEEFTAAESDISLFASPEDNLVVWSLLIEGPRIAGQIPGDGVAADLWTLGKFEAFMESRVAAITDPIAAARYPAVCEKRGDHLYEVTQLPEPESNRLEGVFKELIYYLWPLGAGEKGTPRVILCGKAAAAG